MQAVEKLCGFSIMDIADDRAVLQHVLQIHQTAVVHVLGEVIGVVEMDQIPVRGRPRYAAGAGNGG